VFVDILMLQTGQMKMRDQVGQNREVQLWSTNLRPSYKHRMIAFVARCDLHFHADQIRIFRSIGE